MITPTQACILSRNAWLEVLAASRSGDLQRVQAALANQTRIMHLLFGVPEVERRPNGGSGYKGVKQM